MTLEALLARLENLERLELAELANDDLLEAALEGRVAFDPLARIPSLVVAPMTRKSPRTSAGLSMFAASIAAPIAVPCPIRLCSSSMNRMTSLAAVVSATMARIRSSYWPR